MRTLLTINLIALALCGGCTWNTAAPKTAQPQPRKLADAKAKTPTNKSAQAADAAPEAPESVDSAVQAYIAAIEPFPRAARMTPEETVAGPPGYSPAGEQSAREPEDLPAATRPPVEDRQAARPTAVEANQADPGPYPPEQSAAPPAVSPPPVAPRVTSMSVRAAPDPGVSGAAPDDESPGVNRAASASAPATIRTLLEQWPAEDDTADFRQQLDRRLLSVIAGEYEAARAPLVAVSEQQQAMASQLVESLIAVREKAHGGDPAGAANQVLEAWRQLSSALRPLSDLRIEALVLCREVTGFGQYRPIDPPRFPSGFATEFVVYCEIAGFVSERQEDGLYRSEFEMRTRLMDAGGRTLVDLRDEGIVDVCRRQRQDCFIPRLVRLPTDLAAGEYVLKVTITDTLGQKVAESRTALEVHATR